MICGVVYFIFINCLYKCVIFIYIMVKYVVVFKYIKVVFNYGI